MVLVVFLLAYIVRRRLDAQDRLSGDRLWQRWFHKHATAPAGKESSLKAGIVLIILPALLLGLVVVFLDDYGLRVLAYPLEFLVMVFLMGAPGWGDTLRVYADAWRRGDMQGAWHHVQDRLPAAERGSALSPDAMHLSLSRTFMCSVFERFFLVAFWYVVGGIGLAVLARGIVALSEQWPQSPARPGYRRLEEIVAWIPVRLLSLTFGIAGDLAGWLRDIRRVLTGFGKNKDEVLMISANGSLTGYALDPERFSRIHPDEWVDFGGRSLRAVRDLLNRSMLVWICLLALLVIAGLV
ncbi:histidine kinase [Marinobacter salinexigens]|uniref:Histidine kinase n=1 Tax=Marinobacter salinexigens TaxID=2919747 RepID=A0A5B0VHA8_9GAMM|nr:histidine kinase [Marinobacter salinexigens]KAA1173748.1 histidine kinase [Marinobacter salinexigens]